VLSGTSATKSSPFVPSVRCCCQVPARHSQGAGRVLKACSGHEQQCGPSKVSKQTSGGIHSLGFLFCTSARQLVRLIHSPPACIWAGSAAQQVFAPEAAPARLLRASGPLQIPCRRCTLEPKFVELGLVPFGIPRAFSVRLENVGTTRARFYFVAPPKLRESQDGVMVWDDSQPLCPPWLHISQEDGEVQQGEPEAIGSFLLSTGLCRGS
jgi:hypothetical protein